MKTLADIKKIAVLGAGTMGPGIAQTYAMGGYEVTMWTRSESTREKAIASLKSQLETFKEENLLTESAEAVLGRIHFALTVEEAGAGADFIQETIVEKRDAKEALYEQLAAIVPADVIIASNTSALNIFEIVPEKLLPQQIICHWYAPPHVIPLVEVVKSEQAPQEVFYLIDNGYCDAEAIDLASKASFIPRACVLGICKRIDFGGVDMTYNNFKNKSYAAPQWDHIPNILQEKVDANELGIKTGKGFYDYTGVDMEALKAKRDKQLFEIFNVTKKFMNDPV